MQTSLGVIMTTVMWLMCSGIGLFFFFYVILTRFTVSSDHWTITFLNGPFFTRYKHSWELYFKSCKYTETANA